MGLLYNISVKGQVSDLSTKGLLPNLSIEGLVSNLSTGAFDTKIVMWVLVARVSTGLTQVSDTLDNDAFYCVKQAPCHFCFCYRLQNLNHSTT